MSSKKTSQSEKEKKLEKLCGEIKSKWNEILRLQSHLANVEAESKQLREKTEALEKECREFNSRPDVIAAKSEVETRNGQIERLQGEITRFRKLESMLVAQCGQVGIDPDQEPVNGMSQETIFSKYQQLQNDERAGKLPVGSAHEFFRKNETELRAHADSVRKTEQSRDASSQTKNL